MLASKFKSAYEDVDINDNLEVYRPVRAIMDAYDEIKKIWEDALDAYVRNKAAEDTAGKKISAEDGGARFSVIKEIAADPDIEEKNISDGKAAAEKLIKEAQKSDTPENLVVRNAMYRSDIGYIDFLWGMPGKGEKYKGGYGLSHIIEKRNAENGSGLETLDNIIETIAKSENADAQYSDSLSKDYRRLRLHYGETTAVLSKAPGSNHWLLTGWNNDKTAANAIGEVHDSTDATTVTPTRTRRNGDATVSNNSISEKSKKSNTQNPNMRFMMYDSTGEELTEGQQSYFADSKIRDADGRLKVMYRGGAGDFTVFDRKKSSYSNLYGRGFYFTDSKTHAEQYGKARAFYLDITNPLTPGTKSITKQQLRAFLQEVAENEDYGIENYGYDATVDSILAGLKGKDDFSTLQDINTTCIGDLVAAVELFNEVNGTDFDGIVTPTETVTFTSQQSKETSNKNPTSDPDIRFMQYGTEETAEEKKAREESVSNLKAENDILRARAEYWKAQTQQTKENTVRQQDTDRLANELLREYESKADKAEVKTSLKELGDWLVQNSAEDLSYDELYDRAEDIAEEIVDSNYTLLDDSNAESLEQLKDYLKSNRLNLSAADFRDTGDEDFRKKYGRYFRVSENGMGIDSAWLELGSMFGEGLFPTDTYAPGDMLNMIGDENGKNQKIKIYGLRFLSSTDRYARI